MSEFSRVLLWAIYLPVARCLPDPLGSLSQRAFWTLSFNAPRLNDPARPNDDLDTAACCSVAFWLHPHDVFPNVDVEF
jgi:hypothetical protein